jgi:hypothetical protein
MIDKLNRNSGLLRLLGIDKKTRKPTFPASEVVLIGSELLNDDIRQQLALVPVGQRPLLLAQNLTARVLVQKYGLHDQQSAEYARLSKQICEQLLTSAETAALIDSLVK